MFHSRNTISLFVLTLGLCFFTTQAQATPISFKNLQQVPIQQNQLLESSSMTGHYLNAIQNSKQHRSASNQDSTMLGIKHQRMYTESGIYSLIGLFIAFKAILFFTIGEVIIARGLLFSKSKYYWSRLGRTVFFIGAVLWGVGFAVSSGFAVSASVPSTTNLSAIGITGLLLALNVIGYQYSKVVYIRAFRARIKAVPWIKPSSDGSSISAGLAFSGSF